MILLCKIDLSNKILNGNQFEKILKFEEEEEEIVLVAGIDMQNKLVSEAPRDTIFAILLENQWNQP